MDKFLETVIMDFFIAFGVILGGCLIGGIGAFLAGEPPLHWMWQLADRLKIWALVAAIGGTFDAITAIERGFFSGSHGDIIKQLLFICSAFLGAYIGSVLVKSMIGGQMQ